MKRREEDTSDKGNSEKMSVVEGSGWAWEQLRHQITEAKDWWGKWEIWWHFCFFSKVD